MKTPLALLFIAVVVIAAFLMGRGKPGGQKKQEPPETNTRTMSSQAAAASANVKARMKPRIGADVLTVEKATQLTHEERIALLKKAAVLADPEKQADILCGLISVMTEEEMLEATRTLLDAQRKGNAWSQEVWNTLWTQWGKVNPEACLALSKTGEPYPGWNGLNGLNTPDDYRCLMAGWLEAHPEAALAWARQAKDDFREATGAAFAITNSANGDLQLMEDAILSISGDELTTRACFRDYFDLAASTGDKPSTLYERMDPKLQAAAWPEVVSRLAVADPNEATSWYEKHAKDPGHDDRAAAEMIFRLSEKNPEKTVAWAAGLKNDLSIETQSAHPAMLAWSIWQRRDEAAANAWLQGQPADTPWITRMNALNSGEE